MKGLPIIEPFAGSARYALRYWEHEVLLADTSPYVYETWKYLITASEKDILSLPDVPSDRSLDHYKQLATAERYLIGFHLCRGHAKPRKVGHGQNSWNRDKLRIAKDLYKIKHWKIENVSFEQIENVPATYFIDPPYKAVQLWQGQSRYPKWNVDYRKLAEYAQTRSGRVIVCERQGVIWLPFETLVTCRVNTNNITCRENTEVIFTRDNL